MTRKMEMVDAAVFNYSAFSKDLLKQLKQKNETLSDISVKKLFKSENYLSNALNKKRVPFQIVMSLADWYGLSLRDYKVVKPIELPKEIEKSGAWTCEVKVDEEYGTVMMKVVKDGNTIATGRSFLYGTDDVGVMQSISYAAHMCYKLVQQGAIADVEQCDQRKRVMFKDWIKKYESANSTYGSFARYVASHYEKFPTSGEKQMRYYLQLNKGQAHMNVFTTLFKMYLNWYKEIYNGQ